MKKQLRALLILVLAAAVLAGAYFAIRGIQARRQAEEEQAKKDSVVYLYEPDTISSLVLTNAQGTFAFDYDDFHSSWSYRDDTSYALDKEAMNKFANELMQARIDRTLEMQDDLAPFGLADPAYTLALTDKEGNACTLYFGGKSGDGENYYVMKSGENVIYNVKTNVYMYLEKNVFDYITLTGPAAAELAAVESIEITYGGQTYTLTKETTQETKTITGMNGQPQEETKDVYSWTLDSSDPAFTGVNADIQACMDAVVEQVTEKGMKFISCVDYNLDAARRSDEQLDGSFRVNVTGGTNEDGSAASWNLLIGKAELTYNDRGSIQDGWYYAQIDGDPGVAKVNYTHVRPFIELAEAISGEAVQ